MTINTYKILFAGNSLTYWNKGIDFHIEKMVNTGELDLSVEADSVVKSGANLKELWETTYSKELIKSGKFNIVVLQEDIPETNIDTFKKYVRKFHLECIENRIRLILYMTWAYERLDWINIEEISAAHKEIAKELNIEIAPVGSAWGKVLLNRPEIELFDDDKEHPSQYGTYLSVNVIFSTLYKKKPIHYSGYENIAKKDKEYLQKLAWDEVQNFNY